jgi:hypothetical protein
MDPLSRKVMRPLRWYLRSSDERVSLHRGGPRDAELWGRQSAEIFSTLFWSILPGHCQRVRWRVPNGRTDTFIFTPMNTRGGSRENVSG